MSKRSKSKDTTYLALENRKLRRCIKQVIDFLEYPDGREFWGGDVWIPRAKKLLGIKDDRSKT